MKVIPASHMKVSVTVYRWHFLVFPSPASLPMTNSSAFFGDRFDFTVIGPMTAYERTALL